MSARLMMHEVEGKYPFPIDMLRYDQVVPRDACDVLQIIDSWRREGGVHRLQLSGYVPTGVRTTLTTGRWESFGWRVLRTEAYAALPKLRAERLTAVGGTPFPLQKLQQLGLFPAREEDALRIQETLAREEPGEPVTVELRRHWALGLLLPVLPTGLEVASGWHFSNPRIE